MRRTGQSTAALVQAVSDVILKLGLHPLMLHLDATGARITAAMGREALVTRSRGPYSPDNLPPEAVSTIEQVALRWMLQPERPQFTIEGGGRWPALLMTLPDSRVHVCYVVPEDAPPVYQPDPNNATLSGDILSMLRYLAGSLRLAAATLRREPPVSLTLDYPDDPRYEEYIARRTGDDVDLIPPVLAAFELDRSRCSRKQRAAHDDALRTLAYDDQPVEPLGRTGFTTRIGWARLQDSGT
ncbi:hypothetical protein [Streptomyces aurantiogriseus]|uniref:hypothetical protein n=1 Tax=Streptomyces aurantiogriseus TaxID=66870 RepID=UPI0016761D64|nr:hypothetical protein [Streptomyces aurantiogriseus]